jgi:hypothetical protein
MGTIDRGEYKSLVCHPRLPRNPRFLSGRFAFVQRIELLLFFTAKIALCDFLAMG